MLKTALKYTYLGGITPTALQNEVSTFREMYYDRETWIMFNKSINKILFKIDSVPQDFILPLEIAATFFNNLSPKIRELLTS